MIEPHTCSYCGLQEPTPRKMDMTNHHFCTVEHFKKFYQETKAENVIHCPNALSSMEVRELELECRKLYGDDSPFNALPEDQQQLILTDTMQKIAKLKMEELYIRTAIHRRGMKIDSEQVESLRKYGVSEPKKIQEQKQSSVQKSIVSYWKANLNDTGIAMLISAATGLTSTQATDEINNCRAQNLIGEAR